MTPSCVRLTAALSLLLAGCSAVIPPNDAGEDAWVIDTLRVLHGRPPRSAGEVAALVRLARYNGKAAVVDLLLEDVELVDHWSDVLTDDLGVARYGADRMNPSCYDAPLLAPVEQLLLADHLRSAAVDQPFCLPPVLGEPGDGDGQSTERRAGAPWTPDELAALGATPPPSERALAEKVASAQAAERALDGPLRAPVDPAQWRDRRSPDPSRRVGARELAHAPGARSAHEMTAIDEAAPDLPPDPVVVLSAADDPELYRVCPPFNMTDAISAGILGKSLWVAWRAQLAPDQIFVGGFSNEYPERAAARFWLNTLGRDSGCLPCHTSTYSTTEARPRNQEWDRFFPPTGPAGSLVDIEGAALTVHDAAGIDYGGFGETYFDLLSFFRDDVRSNPAPGLRPWGMASACVSSPPYSGFVTGLPAGNGPAAFGEMADVNSRDALYIMNRFPEFIDGFSFVTSPLAAYTPGSGAPATGANVYNDVCAGCHAAPPSFPLAPDLADIVPWMSDRKLRRVIEHGSMSMEVPLNANQAPLSGAEVDDLIAYLRDPAFGGMPFEGPSPYANAEDGVGHLIALQIVNRVVEDIQGQPLVLSHGFPRSAEAAVALDLLVRVFVESGWSLQSLLRWIVLTDMFNRAAPAETATAASGPLAYELPMLAHPWAADPPGTPPATGRDHNGTGDLVHRSNVSAMIRHVHEALGWPEAMPVSPGVASNTAFPWADLQRDLGRPDSFEATTGLPTMELANLLQWERAVGTCNKPARVRGVDVALALAPNAVVDAAGNVNNPEHWIDWVDALVAATPPGTARDVARAIKSRLLAEPGLSSDEEALYAALWGLPDLDAPASAVDEAAMRRACGVLLMSPDFLLRRMPAPVAGPPTPMAWEVCLEPECTEAAFCASYVPRLRELGYDRDCSNNVSEPGDEDDPPE